MYHAAAVSVTYSGGDVVGQRQSLIKRQGRRALNVLGEALAGQIFLDEVGAALLFTEIVDRNEVAVCDARCALGLLPEAGTRRLGSGEMTTEQLDRDGALLGVVGRPEDLRDTPSADPLL